MPYPILYGAIVLSGIAIVGYALYEQHKERQRYGYQQSYNYSQSDTFRHSNDFDFNDNENHENNEKHREANDDADRYTLRTETSQLRNRKPFPNEETDDVDNRRKSIDQDQYELDELESVVAERRRRLMAEQSFLDKEEEELRNRRQALMEKEQMFEKCDQGRKTTTSSSDSDNDNDEEHLDVFKPFVEKPQPSSFIESSDSNSSSGDETTASSIAKAEGDRNQHLYSSDLQFPTSSHARTESEAAISSDESKAAISSEESWDVFSENEWNGRDTDDEA